MFMSSFLSRSDFCKQPCRKNVYFVTKDQILAHKCANLLFSLSLFHTLTPASTKALVTFNNGPRVCSLIIPPFYRDNFNVSETVDCLLIAVIKRPRP